MVAYFYNQKCVSGLSYFNSFDPGSCGLFDGSSLQTLVLDGEKGELVKAPAVGNVGKKTVSEAKSLAALKSHSEAERRRRERINAHLATLRGLVPCNEKMDKATLLAEVIKQVKELKKSAKEASQGLLIPMDDDQVEVEPYGDGISSFKASLCCDYRSDLLSDTRQAIEGLRLKLVDAEISTLGGRLKTVLFLSSCTNKNVAEDADVLVSSIKKALSSIVEKCSLSPAYSPRTTLPYKKMRVGFFDSPGSSS
ncbi:basic helix-loop-helix (bHLH) DNA-binding superfamily protein [Euphorbia peplus]|nr:basic helix-loop-helix (bHLH) DNA-binding superfamily protein [Euphorbia peplus]